MPQRPTTIYRAIDPFEAHMLRDLLADYGVDGVVTGEPLLGGAGELTHSAGGIRVLVSHRDAELGKMIADAFQRHILQTHIPDDETLDELPREWTTWPECPGCRHRRLTICPTCGTSGIDFPLADVQPLSVPPSDSQFGPPRSAGEPFADDPHILLMCEVCDEAFSPCFYRICPWCAHDFGEGRETTVEMLDEASTNTRILLLGVGVAVLAFMGYLWLLSF